MGRPINHALATKEALSCEDPDRGVVGFYGSADSIRILTLGLKTRQVLQVRCFPTINTSEASESSNAKLGSSLNRKHSFLTTGLSTQLHN